MPRSMIAVVLCLAFIAVPAIGCGRRHGRTDRKIRTIRQGIQNVDQHATNIEQAAKGGNEKPAEP